MCRLASAVPQWVCQANQQEVQRQVFAPDFLLVYRANLKGASSLWVYQANLKDAAAATELLFWLEVVHLLPFLTQVPSGQAWAPLALLSAAVVANLVGQYRLQESAAADPVARLRQRDSLVRREILPLARHKEQAHRSQTSGA
jgi:hypothetical protein